MKRITLLLMAFILLCSCGQSFEEKRRLTKAEKQRLVKENAEALKIAVMPTLDCLPLFVAQQLHLFDTLKVNVRLKPFTAQMDCDTAIVGGSVEGVVSDLIRTEKLKKDGHALDYLTSTVLEWQLLSNRRARLRKIDQLGDKMIAMTRYSGTDYLTDRVLQGVKTNAQVFKVQINDVNVRLQMLLNNEMDAMWLPEPQATTARLQKHLILLESNKLGEHLGVIAFRHISMKTKHRQQQLILFERGYNNAVDSINKNGLKHYSDLIVQFCGTKASTVQSLPNIKFQKIAQPLDVNVEKARQYVSKL